MHGRNIDGAQKLDTNLFPGSDVQPSGTNRRDTSIDSAEASHKVGRGQSERIKQFYSVQTDALLAIYTLSTPAFAPSLIPYAFLLMSFRILWSILEWSLR